MNPPNYEGVNPLLDTILNRTVTFEPGFPPVKDELKIVASQLRKAGFKPSEFSLDRNGRPKGKYADEIVDFIKIVDNLRGTGTSQISLRTGGSRISAQRCGRATSLRGSSATHTSEAKR